MDELAALRGRVAAALAAEELVVVSGIPPGNDGTGRLVAHLENQFREFGADRVRVLARPERLAAWQLLAWTRQRRYFQAGAAVLRYGFRLLRFLLGVGAVLARPARRIVLLHPQNLGYRLSWRLLRSRRNPPLVYLLDSSYFCIASYNHLPGTWAPCVKCAELGPAEARRNQCKPFPRPDWHAEAFVARLLPLVRGGRVRICAQNRRQAERAQRYFSLDALPPVIGLWTQDWDEIRRDSVPASDSLETTSDVVFHGHGLGAKGALWLAAVARNCPTLRFTFPFARPAWFPEVPNCRFVPCTWESGLRDLVARSRFVAVPSLWSAPIEGALVKSVVFARAVIVAENPESFCSEFPADLVLALPANPDEAAPRLLAASAGSWAPDPTARRQWLETLIASGDRFALRLVDCALPVA